MTVPSQENQAQTQPTDKELNFRKLEAHYESKLQAERQARLDAEKAAQEALMRRQEESEEEEDDPEPYVDKKKLNKTLQKFNEQTKKQTKSEIQQAVEMAKQEARKEQWLENNPDFYDTLEQNVNKFALKYPQLAKTILAMPDGFERQKLVYQNIKELGIDKPEQKPSTIQDKIDSNRKGMYYQPTGIGAAPYSNSSDFSQQGQKQAYDKMQELKNRLRL